MNGSLFRTAFSDSANQLFPDGWPPEVMRAWNELSKQPQSIANLSAMTDDDLVACTNELMRRAVECLRSVDDYFHLNIYAGGFRGSDVSFDITQQAQIGLSTPQELRVASGNIFESIERLKQMKALRDGATPPVVVQPMLPAPEPTPGPPYADFTPVPDPDDDILF